MKALYVSGEESLRQLAGRKKRLGLKSPFSLLVTNRLDDITQAVEKEDYGLLIIDSIQSIYNSRLAFLPGSTSQIRDVSSRLIRESKSREITHVFIGHVTKEGAIAGPKILEHMVDTVLYFEGDRTMPYRMLRAIKNRYGPVDEIGLFQMSQTGLVSVEPSLYFLSERGQAGPGSTLFPHVTGSRPLVMEVQAICPKTSFSFSKKLSIGYDVNRLFILVAVLEKSLGMPFSDRDVYVNLTGGIKVGEPGIDLAIAASILSSQRDETWGEAAFFGEIGLTGEVRRVVAAEMRLRECERLHIKKVFCPPAGETPPGIEVVPIKHVRELVRAVSEARGALTGTETRDKTKRRKANAEDSGRLDSRLLRGRAMRRPAQRVPSDVYHPHASWHLFNRLGTWGYPANRVSTDMGWPPADALHSASTYRDPLRRSPNRNRR